MPRSRSESEPTNREMIVEILHTLNSLKLEISRLTNDLAYLKQKQRESEESRKNWIW